MKIDFTQPILDLDNKPVMEEGKAVTLKKLAINSLLAVLIDERQQPEQLDGETKVKHSLLAQTIYSKPENVELKAEEVALLKSRIARMYSPWSVMRAWNLLEAK